MSNIKVELNSIYPSGDIRAYATATVEDCLSIRGIRIMEGNQNDIYIAMPSRKTENGSKPICHTPSSEFKVELYEALQDAYYGAIVPVYDAEQEFELEETQEEELEQEDRYTIQMDNIKVKIGSVYSSDENNGIRAFAVATIDEMIEIKGIKVVEGGDGLFVAMPSRKTVDGYKEVCSLITDDFKAMFNMTVLDSYQQTIAQSQEQEMDEEQEQAEELELEENNTMQMGSM